MWLLPFTIEFVEALLFIHDYTTTYTIQRPGENSHQQKYQSDFTKIKAKQQRQPLRKNKSKQKENNTT